MGASSPIEVVRRFDRLKKKGDGWLASCPAHKDDTQSLSIDVRDGKVLLKCFAGCTVEEILAAKAIEKAELFLESGLKSSSAPGGITVESLAASKGLPVETLRKYGVKTVREMPPSDRLLHGIGGSDGVWIPYFLPDGSLATRTRLRTAHVAKDGSRWLGGFGSPVPYGLHDLEDAKAQGVLVVCEGESDYWTLRTAGIPALGIPGANMVKLLRPEYLIGVSAIYVAQDSDPAGAGFVAGVRQHLASCGQWGVFPVPMPAGLKDVNELYRRDPSGFAARFLALMQTAAVSGAPPAREFSTAGEIYTLTAPEWGLRLELDQIRRSSWGELTGELAVASDAIGDVFRGSINLSNVERRQGVAQQIAKRSGLLDVDWPALLEDYAIRCLKAERDGAAWIDLRTVEIPPAESTWEIEGFRLSRLDATCLFGDGGTGKSLIALYLAGCLARQGIRVAYLDAEWHEGEHKARLVSLFGDDPPAVVYASHRRALELGIQQIKRKLIEMRTEYVVLDSVGLLTVGAPEMSEAALGYSRAVQQLGIGSLSLAHVTKNGDTSPQQMKPFGSVFYHNLFRRTYYAKAEEDAPGPHIKRLVIWNSKWNHRGAGQRPFGLEVEDAGERTIIRQVDATSVEGLANKLPVWRRIDAALKRGPKSAAELADEIEAGENAVRVALSKGKKSGKYVQVGGSGSAAWALTTEDEHQ